MSKHKGVHIKILNPISGRGYTSRKSAERYVRRGVARWAKDRSGRECLEFVTGGAIAALIFRSVARKTAYDRAAHTGLARLPELASLPVIAPGVLLGFGKRKGASRHTFVASQGR